MPIQSESGVSAFEGMLTCAVVDDGQRVLGQLAGSGSRAELGVHFGKAMHGNSYFFYYSIQL